MKFIVYNISIFFVAYFSIIKAANNPYLVCDTHDWACKERQARKCEEKANECWEKPWYDTQSQDCIEINRTCNEIWTYTGSGSSSSFTTVSSIATSSTLLPKTTTTTTIKTTTTTTTTTTIKKTTKTIFITSTISNAEPTTSNNNAAAPPPPPPSPKLATFYTTSSDGQKSLQKSTSAISNKKSNSSNQITLNPSQSYQTMDGFGFAITYSTCYNLMKMSSEDRTKFLKQTYSESEGYGVSYARISIGCSDFSSTEYSLCDTPGLENFKLFTDETQYVIPILKEILAIHPNLKIIATPWTSPKWMKVKDLESKAPFDSWTSGHLNPDYYTTYAEYFVKFIQAMNENNIPIYAVSPQNEPLNKGNSASLYMPWQEEVSFVKALAKTFKQNSITAKIYVFDHNYNYDNISDQTDYPIKVYQALGTGFEGSELVVGAAYHDYGGNNSELSDIHTQAPNMELIFSETSIGTWNDGRQLSKRLLSDMKNVALATVNQWCRAVLVWNMMLDETMGPNRKGGCQTCFGAVDIDLNYKTIHRNSHYYIISHMSSVVRSGAKRIGATSQNIGDQLVYSAFQNSENSYAVVLSNSSNSSITVSINVNRNGEDNTVDVVVPEKSVVSSLLEL